MAESHLITACFMVLSFAGGVAWALLGFHHAGSWTVGQLWGLVAVAVAFAIGLFIGGVLLDAGEFVPEEETNL